jgi:uncharacterized membrane-anchored protein
MKLRYLFAAILVTAILQTAWVAKMITDRAAILRNGTEVMLETGFVDPRDLFRGHYVRLNLKISRLRGALAPSFILPDVGQPIWVSLEKGEDGFWQPVTTDVNAPQGAVSLRGTFQSRSGGGQISDRQINIDFPFDRYFAPEARALELEDLRQDQRLGIVLAVMPNGTAAVKGIVIDGEPIYDEPLY